jgi:hypothetical protein
VKAFLDKNFQAKTTGCILDWSNGDAGKALSEAVDRFMRYENMRETLLILLYSGGGWARENTGKLELWPRWHIIPGIDWMDLVGEKLLATSSDLVLLFDLPTPTPADFTSQRFLDRSKFSIWTRKARTPGVSSALCRFLRMRTEAAHGKVEELRIPGS